MAIKNHISAIILIILHNKNQVDQYVGYLPIKEQIICLGSNNM